MDTEGEREDEINWESRTDVQVYKDKIEKSEMY